MTPLRPAQHPLGHTAMPGRGRPGSPTPRAYVADNDLALGRLVDAGTHSAYGRDTAIAVTVDDAQSRADHIDAHRTLTRQPLTRTGAVDSTLYPTASMLRTIEDLVGIGPLTHFDAQATPMTGSARPLAGTATNSATAPLAAVSARQPLGKERTRSTKRAATKRSGKASREPAA